MGKPLSINHANVVNRQAHIWLGIITKEGNVESVINQLKNINQIERTRHRSVYDFLINLVAGLTAYSLQCKKPSIDVHFSGVTVVRFLLRIHVK